VRAAVGVTNLHSDEARQMNSYSGTRGNGIANPQNDAAAVISFMARARCCQPGPQGKNMMSDRIKVILHIGVTVRKDQVSYVREWMDGITGYTLGDGWAFNQNVQDYITYDGMREYEWNELMRSDGKG